MVSSKGETGPEEQHEKQEMVADRSEGLYLAFYTVKKATLFTMRKSFIIYTQLERHKTPILSDFLSCTWLFGCLT